MQPFEGAAMLSTAKETRKFMGFCSAKKLRGVCLCTQAIFPFPFLFQVSFSRHCYCFSSRIPFSAPLSGFFSIISGNLLTPPTLLQNMQDPAARSPVFPHKP
jgi:hypothetical protein